MRSVLETAKLFTESFTMLPENVENDQELISKLSEQVLFAARLGKNHLDIAYFKKPYFEQNIIKYNFIKNWIVLQKFTLIEFEDSDGLLLSVYW